MSLVFSGWQEKLWLDKVIISGGKKRKVKEIPAG